MYLNLARKWRSKKFEEVIGQDFAIKILKNCLYRDLISPVYLISGPKGCGKTTVARLFAAALNCENLLKFREDPKNVSLPCSSCQSCFLFNKSAHPDFIEIDAASNTGVENVRQIIDSTSFIPALGFKRIYLIDEAHMLSKAAFNALLKTLEEPPASVLFILATTEVNKIIETVRSRCFQLFFSPIDKESLLNYLALICKTEEIEFDNDALKFIVQESHGSARDALNLLEKVRAGFNVINKETIFKALGFMPEEDIITLFELILQKKTQEVISFYINHNLDQFDQFILFRKIVNLIYSSITLRMDLPSNENEISISKLQAQIVIYPLDFFIKMLDLCYAVEIILLKTSSPSILMQNLLIKLCLVNSNPGSSAVVSSVNSGNGIKAAFSSSSKKIEVAPIKSVQISNHINGNTFLNETNVANSSTQTNKEWQIFLSALDKANDPLILSIFKQGHFKMLGTNIQLSFNKELIFFKDCLERAKASWRPLLNEAFKSEKLPSNEVNIEFIFDSTIKSLVTAATQIPESKTINSEELNKETSKKFEMKVKPDYPAAGGTGFFKKTGTKINIPDKTIPIDLDKFQKVNIISKIFPGRVTSSLAIDNTLERKNE